MDALEKERLRRKMAIRMKAFQGSATGVSCVSGHWNAEEQPCDLCETAHGNEVLVIKNRAGKKYKVGAKCITEMVRFQVTEVESLTRWLAKMPELKAETTRREEEQKLEREEERKRLEKRVIVRRRSPESKRV